MNKKIKVFMIGDHPLAVSGVGHQTGIIAKALLDSGKFSVISFAGAIKHNDYRPQKVEEYGDDWIIFKVNGYGDQDSVRSILRTHKPDILWFMTDPRFYHWLWDIENEVRGLIPMVYYHVWDNYPYPKYNEPLYLSNDKIVTISKVTSDIVKTVSPTVEEEYLPHSVDTDVFKPYPRNEIHKFRQQHFSKFLDSPDQLVFFWNSRNASRKLSGTLIFWFNNWLEKNGFDKAKLLMHTEPNDPNGQDLVRIIHDLDLYKDGRNNVILSSDKVPPNILAMMYNACDATIGISNAEGFGLSTFESLACGTPIIVNKTGGLQEQITDGKNNFGIGIEPKCKLVIGSQQVPYVREDRILEDDFHEALDIFVNTPRKQRQEWGKLGREHVVKNYNFEKFKQRWIELMLEVHEKHGSWETRKHKSWSIKEVK